MRLAEITPRTVHRCVTHEVSGTLSTVKMTRDSRIRKSIKVVTISTMLQSYQTVLVCFLCFSNTWQGTWQIVTLQRRCITECWDATDRTDIKTQSNCETEAPTCRIHRRNEGELVLRLLNSSARSRIQKGVRESGESWVLLKQRALGGHRELSRKKLDVLRVRGAGKRSQVTTWRREAALWGGHWKSQGSSRETPNAMKMPQKRKSIL